MKSTKLVFLLISYCFLTTKAQIGFQACSKMKKYCPTEVCSKEEGITLYDRLMENIGDSLRYNKDGYNVHGWLDDYYTNGKLLHRGFYRDGKVVAFKNYYENGVCERIVTEPDALHCTIDKYCENGKHRKQISYYNGILKKQIDYYENGQQKSLYEYDDEGKMVVNKKMWDEYGNLEYELTLVDVKQKKFREKTYYSNGKVKEEGGLIFSLENNSLIKNGTWHSYDADGKNRRSAKHSGAILTSN